MTAVVNISYWNCDALLRFYFQEQNTFFVDMITRIRFTLTGLRRFHFSSTMFNILHVVILVLERVNK